MRQSLRQQLHWRDLDVAQMAHWPNTVRRWVLALLGIALLACLMLMLVWPRVALLETELMRIRSTQQQIRQALAVPPDVLELVPPARMIRADEEAQWLASLLASTRERNLSVVSLKLQEPSETERKALADAIDYAVKENARTFHREALKYSTDWLSQTAVLNISVQGTYADILGFASDLGRHNEWLGVVSSDLEAVGSDQVRWSVRFWCFKENVKKAERNGTK